MLEIFCKARLRLALQKISTCSLTHDVSSLEDDNIKYTCIFRTEKKYVYEIEVSINIFLYFLTMYLYSRICIVYSSTNPWYIVLILQCRVFTKFLNLNTKRQLKPFYIFLEFPFWCLWRVACSTSIHLSIALRST